MGKKNRGKRGKKKPSATAEGSAKEDLELVASYAKGLLHAATRPSTSEWTTWNRIEDVIKSMDKIVQLQSRGMKRVHPSERKAGASETAKAGPKGGGTQGRAREMNLERFEEWLSEVGGMDLESRKWKFTDYGASTGFGVVCSDPNAAAAAADDDDGGSSSKGAVVIGPEETIVATPHALVMSTDTAIMDASLGPSLVSDKLIFERPTLVLALHLMLERKRGGGSKWKPYIDTLPRTFSVPYHWSLNDFYALRGSPSFSMAVKTVCSMGYMYAYLFNKIMTGKMVFGEEEPHLNSFPLELFRWAISIVVTRQNPLPSPTAVSQNTLALVPVMDMFNHRYESCTPHYDAGKQQVCVTTGKGKSYKHGEQLHMSYGTRPNRELLVYSGFVMKDNPYDNIPLRLRLQGNDPLAKARLLVLNHEGIYPIRGKGVTRVQDAEYLFLVTRNGPPTKELWYFAHVIAMDKDGIAAVLRGSKETGEAREQLIVGLEHVGEAVRRQALSMIHKFAASMIDQIESSQVGSAKRSASHTTGNLALIEATISTELDCLRNCVEWCATMFDSIKDGGGSGGGVEKAEEGKKEGGDAPAASGSS